MKSSRHNFRLLNKFSCGLLVGVSLVACQAINASAEVPAHLTSAAAAQTSVQQQLRQMVASSLNVDISVVNLADDTLINSSQFVFARTPRYESSGQLMQGRVVEPVNVFKLVLRDQQCWLDYQGTVQHPAKKIRLAEAQCKPE
ncbi:hypothetical protein AAKU64_000323 [Undibacterium sp. GrIS 1.8]|uniref:hypothetical protein n=1 Tax=Undibacterium sp. GrIS 1.8 TaxID=3143934 RepID=UPI003397B66F